MAASTPFSLDQMGADITRDEGLYTGKVNALTDKSTQIGAAREATLAPMEATIQKQLAEPMPERQKVDIPQFKPQPIIDSKDYEKLSYGLIAMAMIGGVASKGKWLEVGDTLNGALNGYLKGNQEVAKKGYEDYQRQFQGAMAKEAQANKEFEDILRDKKMRIQDQISQYRIVAAKYDRQDAMVAAQSRSLDAMWRSIESRKTAMAKLQESHDMAQQSFELRSQIHADSQANKAAAGNKGGFEGRNGEILAALAERGANLPTGFRSKEQQVGLLNALSARYPNSTPDQIADKIVAGQLDLKGQTKEVQVAASQAGKIAYAENEIDQVIPLVREASANLPRGQFVPYNRIKQMGEKAFSDPDLKEFAAYMTTLSNAYDMLAARGGTDMEKRKHNRELFDTADSPEALERSLKAVKNEAQASGRAARASMDVTHAAPSKENPPNLAKPSAAPQGVEQSIWDHMTPEEQGLWSRPSANEPKFTPRP